MRTNQFPVPQSDRNLTILAWVVTLLVSTVPDILMDKLAGGIPAWLTDAKLGLLLVLILACFFLKALRPLYNFLLVMFAFFTLFELLPLVNFTLPGLQALFGNSVFDVRMQAEQIGKLAVSIAMILVLLWLGRGRLDLFLRGGDLRAPIEPVRVLGFPKPEPWTKFGLLWGFCISGALAVVFYLGARPGGVTLLKVLPILPSILFYAVLNSFNEEITFRVPMLATLEPVGGSRQALWISAFFFGIAHYFGTPGGILGGILSIFMGWILGKAMLETRGLFWSWWIHFLSDVVIFFFLAVALV
jgi:membrane protease YdiL (CAAX protease family)